MSRMDSIPRRMPEDDAPTRVRGAERSGVSRRTFVVGTGSAVVAVGAGGVAGLRFARDGDRPEFDTSGRTGRLDDGELRALLALLDVLVSPERRASPSENTALIHLATETEPGVLSEYRAGARLLNGWAGERGAGSFAAMVPPAREEVLGAVLWRFEAEDGSGTAAYVTKGRRRLERWAHSGGERRFRELVVRDLLQRYHRRHFWKLVGYRNLPGVPGDPREYVRPPEPGSAS